MAFDQDPENVKIARSEGTIPDVQKMMADAKTYSIEDPPEYRTTVTAWTWPLQSECGRETVKNSVVK